MKISRQLTKRYQNEFEQVLPVNIDRTKDENGDYVNLATQAMWLGFMLRIPVGKTKGINHFIIARHDVNGFPYFSDKPRLHKNNDAVVELERLSNAHPGMTFGLYQLVDSAKVKKNKEQILFFDYAANRMYLIFEEDAKHKPYYVMDDFGNAVMPSIYAWIFEGELLQYRKMQGLPIHPPKTKADRKTTA